MDASGGPLNAKLRPALDMPRFRDFFRRPQKAGLLRYAAYARVTLDVASVTNVLIWRENLRHTVFVTPLYCLDDFAIKMSSSVILVGHG